jgi:hypothetical protein
MPIVKADVHAPIFCFPKLIKYKTMVQDIYTDYEIKEFSAAEPLSDIDGYMHDWVFHFNPYNKMWNAIPRDLYTKYWDNCELDGVLRSKDVSTLLHLLHKCKGDVIEIHKLTSTK